LDRRKDIADDDYRLLDGLRVTAASPGRVRFEVQVMKEHTASSLLPKIPNQGTYVLIWDIQNRLNILHGGTIASMVDLGGSLAVASRGLFATGVSTDLNGK
jgi:acyl-coenzyme A thioesterase 13